MSQRYLVLAAVLLFPSAARAEDKVILPPNAPAPQVCLATASEKDGVIEIRISIPRMIAYQVTRKVPVTETVIVNGKPMLRTKFETVTVTEHKGVMEAITLHAADKDFKVSCKDGKSVDFKELPKLLVKRTHVLVVADKDIDPYYLDVINDHVLIFTVPNSKLPQPKLKD